jgi:hypothetical protein
LAATLRQTTEKQERLIADLHVELRRVRRSGQP